MIDQVIESANPPRATAHTHRYHAATVRTTPPCGIRFPCRRPMENKCVHCEVLTKEDGQKDVACGGGGRRKKRQRANWRNLSAQPATTGHVRNHPEFFPFLLGRRQGPPKHKIPEFSGTRGRGILGYFGDISAQSRKWNGCCEYCNRLKICMRASTL